MGETMKIANVSVIGNQIMVDNIEPITSGTVGATIDLAFSSEWEKLSKTAVFKAGNVVKDVANVDGIVAIPWEVLEKPNRQLYIGVKGFNEEGTLVIPTSYAFINNIVAGTVTSASNEPPTPSVIEQIQAQVDNAESMAQEVLNAYKSGELNGKDYEHSEEFSQLAEQVRADAGTAGSEAEKAGAFKSDAANSASSAANEAGQAAASAAAAAQSASAAAEDARVAKAANEITLGNATRAESAEAAAEQSASGILGQAEKAESAASLASAKAAVALNAATESRASANTSAEFAGHARKSADAAEKAVASIGTSVQDCETYASRATEAATSAAQSASDALTAKNAASQSAQQAVESAGTAKTEASRSASAAGAADTSRRDAEGAANRAANSETAAAGSARAAEDAKTEAQGKATSASQSAGQASQSATTATGAAGRAAESAQTASKAAETATSKAAEATNQANRAKSEADRAKSEADRAAENGKALIDDNSISADKTQSSLALYSRLCPPFEVSGPIVTCDPVEHWPLHVVTEITPQQEGSGDPSPENVRNFVPVQSVELTRCGANILQYEKGSETINGVNFTVNPDKSITINGKATGRAVFRMIDNYRTPMHVPKCYAFAVAPGSEVSMGITIRRGGYGANHAYFTEQGTGVYLNVSGDLVSVFLSVELGTEVKNETVYPMLVAENNRVPYEPPRFETFTAQLPEPVYGGKLDWGTGEIENGYERIVLDGTESGWNAGDLDTGVSQMELQKNAIYPFEDGNKVGPIYCNYFKRTSTTDGWHGVSVNSCALSQAGYPRFYVPKTTLPEWKKMLADRKAEGNPVVLVVKRTNPTSGQATVSGSPLALPGTNTLYTDVGDTTVSGRKDLIAVIEDQQAQIEALQKNALGGI